VFKEKMRMLDWWKRYVDYVVESAECKGRRKITWKEIVLEDFEKSPFKCGIRRGL